MQYAVTARTVRISDAMSVPLPCENIFLTNP
jgi:hypothetical protein